MYAEEEGEVFLGRSMGSQASNVSGETARQIDEEVRRIIDECYATAKKLLVENRDKLDAMAEALMKYETIDAEQIDDIMNGREPREPRGWDGGGDSGAPQARSTSQIVLKSPLVGRRPSTKVSYVSSATPEPATLW